MLLLNYLVYREEIVALWFGLVLGLLSLCTNRTAGSTQLPDQTVPEGSSPEKTVSSAQDTMPSA
jgi:hypothetical protein